MGAPAEMPADEALKSLVSRFRDAPGSAAFTELAAALLVRGHASEALRIAEHGLQLLPSNVDGRIERAAALLALGRPRVAFVELKRALAINPTNRRAMRLLGKVYVDAGAPGRAAELLAQRSTLGEELDSAEQEPTHVTHAPFPFGDEEGTAQVPTSSLVTRETTAPTAKRPPISPAMPPRGAPSPNLPATPYDRNAPPSMAAHGAGERGAAALAGAHGAGSPAIERAPTPYPLAHPMGSGSSAAPTKPLSRQALPDLFSDLTRDLGLGTAAIEGPKKRVEVTQIIRRRGLRTLRGPAELAVIDGPIVDTTQRGQHENAFEGSGEAVAPLPTAPSLGLFDAVTSPQLQLAQFSLGDEPLFQEHMPFAVRPVEGPTDELDSSDLRETIDEERPPELDPTPLRQALDVTPSSGLFSDLGDTLVEHFDAGAAPLGPIPPPDLGAPPDAPRLEQPGRVIEVARSPRRPAAAPKLELIEPKAPALRVALAIAGAIAMVGIIAFLIAATPPAWRKSLFGISEESAGNAAPHETGSTTDGPGEPETDRRVK